MTVIKRVCGFYLDACIEEDPDDGSLIRAAPGDIALAKTVKRALAWQISTEALRQELAENAPAIKNLP